MTNNPIPREEEIFHAARAIASPEPRAAYLVQTCGEDAALRERVDALLTVFDAELSSAGLMSPGSAGSALFERLSESPQPPVEQPVGTVIGRYKLLERLGEGGFGVVFMAEQQFPVRRKVALKLIKAGLDTKQVIARFEAERQALAMMEHENIAKVLDAGATDAGRPYFVMELVHGVPITGYCDDNKLSPRERLELFVRVCRAVQHAHTKGIIHRDIKPTNVLVTTHDGVAVPKVIDFGVAKATGQQALTDRTLFTQFAQMVGTPLYMSPEQAELSGLDVDTRSDVYSLGVLLYELLTGTTPFDKERLHKAAHDEVRRIIREEEPPIPSTRISALGDKLAAVSADRKTDARRLGQLVRGELDWIVMKALEKERGRRYETASGFGRDVERYLQNEPVAACPPSATYRLRKLARRHRRTVVASALLLVALLGGIAATTWQAVRARQAERAALASAERANAIRDLLQDMLASANPDQVKGTDYTVRQLLDDAAARIGNQLEDQPESEAAIRETIGRAYRRLSLPEKARPHIDRALELYRRINGAQHVTVARSLLDSASILMDQRRLADAEHQAEEALAIYRARRVTGQPLVHALWIRSLILGQQRRYDESIAAGEEAIAYARDSGQLGSPEAASLMYVIAGGKLQQRKYVEAEPIARLGVEMQRRARGSDHPETGWALRGLGRALKEQRKFEEAERVSLEALSIFRRQFGPKHNGVTAMLDDLTWLYRETGNRDGVQRIARERFAAAGAESGGAGSITMDTAPTSRASTQTSAARWSGHETLQDLRDAARRFRALNQPDKAAELLLRAIDVAEQSVPRSEDLVVTSHYEYVEVLKDLRRYELAEAVLMHMRVTVPRTEIARVREGLIAVYAAWGKPEPLLRQLELRVEKAIEAFPRGHASFPKIVDYQIEHANVLAGLKQFEEAEAVLKAARAAADATQFQIVLHRLALLYADWGKPAEAEWIRAELATPATAPAMTHK